MMRKPVVRAAILALAAGALLSLAACSAGGSQAGPSANSSSGLAVGSSAESAGALTSSQAAGAAGESSGKYPTIADFLESDLMRSQVASARESLGGDLMDIDLAAEGNRLVYSFTYRDLEGQDLAALGEALAAELETENLASAYRSIAATLQSAVDVADPVVVVTYLAPDGSTLASKEYQAE